MTRASLLSLLALSACASNKPAAPAASEPVIVTRPMPGLEQKEADADDRPEADRGRARREVRTGRGGADLARARPGRRALEADDGDLAEFARDQFQPQGKPLDALLARLEAELEQVDGHFLEIGRELQAPAQLDVGPLLPVDPLFAACDAAAPLHRGSLRHQDRVRRAAELPAHHARRAGPRRRRRTPAASGPRSRLAGRFARRVPGEVARQIAQAGAAADLYIAEYNVWMHHLLDEKGERLFPKGLRLITHWNLRDELKADYADPKGLQKQRMIAKVMERIVTQTIPAAVIDNPRVDWNPFTNDGDGRAGSRGRGRRARPRGEGRPRARARTCATRSCSPSSGPRRPPIRTRRPRRPRSCAASSCSARCPSSG